MLLCVVAPFSVPRKSGLRRMNCYVARENLFSGLDSLTMSTSDSIRAYPNNRLVMRPSFAAGRNRAGYLDRL